MTEAINLTLWHLFIEINYQFDITNMVCIDFNLWDWKVTLRQPKFFVLLGKLHNTQTYLFCWVSYTIHRLTFSLRCVIKFQVSWNGQKWNYRSQTRLSRTNPSAFQLILLLFSRNLICQNFGCLKVTFQSQRLKSIQTMFVMSNW
jgi:hypothetical protein